MCILGRVAGVNHWVGSCYSNYILSARWRHTPASCHCCRFTRSSFLQKCTWSCNINRILCAYISRLCMEYFVY